MAELTDRDPVANADRATRLVVGPGAIRRLGEIARGLGATRALVTSDRGQFVAIAPPASQQPAPAPKSTDTDDETGGVSLYQSLFETGFRNDIPRPIIDQLLRVFFFDTDLQKRVNDGDSFEVFYNDDDEREARKEVLYASLTTGNTTRRYYRYQSGKSGSVDHYDETGRSNRAFLLRKPITEGTLRSGFGTRYHPVLHYSKMHTGIDWSDKIGTPIIAAGDGLVIKAEWDSGYGCYTFCWEPIFCTSLSSIVHTVLSCAPFLWCLDYQRLCIMIITTITANLSKRKSGFLSVIYCWRVSFIF
jgi:hypothetical protein